MTADSTGRAFISYRIVMVITGVILTITGVVNAVAPSTAARAVLVALVVALILAWGLTPLIRGARPRALWSFAAVDCGFLLLAVAIRPESFAPQLGPADLVYAMGYLGFSVWIVLFARRLNALAPRQLLIDAAAATTAVLLGLFTFLHPNGDHGSLGEAFQPLVFPILDAVVLAICAHLSLRLGRTVPAWWFQTVGVGLQFLLDTAYAFGLGHLDPTSKAAFESLFALPFFLIAVTATHPAVAYVGDMRLPDRSTGRHVRQTLVVSLLVLPAFGSLLLPARRDVDWNVRFILVALLLVLLFAQLALTLRELQSAERDSHHRATHDPLTGLMNRSALVEHLARLLAAEAHTSRVVALFFLDCDHFKQVNDTWGHHAGDALLQGIAAALPRAVRPHDLVARHGGDEFVVAAVLPDPDTVHSVAARLQACLAPPITIAPGRTHRVESSIGVAVARHGDISDPMALIARADAALYEAKALGRNRYVVWHEELGRRKAAQAAIGDALRSAVAQDLLTIHLQPIMGGPGHTRLVGWEALARWTHPELGPIPPDRFIPLAEEFGVMHELGTVVLRKACAALAALRAEHGCDQSVFVNVSPTQPARPDFVDEVLHIVRSEGLEPHDLWLEITENILITGPEVRDRLELLREAGVRVGLDDFGTGYASMATLLRLPVDCVKIDRSLVQSAHGPTGKPDVFGHLLGMLRGLGIENIVAEGVETEEQARMVSDLACPMAQGWYFDRPAPLARWLAGPAPGLDPPAAGPPEGEGDLADPVRAGSTAGP